MMATGGSRFDLDRFGTIFRASPRQADPMIVSGTVTKKHAEFVRRLYDQTLGYLFYVSDKEKAAGFLPYIDDFFPVYNQRRAPVSP